VQKQATKKAAAGLGKTSFPLKKLFFICSPFLCN